MPALWVAFGSALGGVCRFGLDRVALLLGLGAFPVATLIANLSGSLLIGYLAGRWSGNPRTGVAGARWLFWVPGVCGGFTTFSGFSWEVLTLIEAGRAQLAGFYAAASIVIGLIAVWIGMSLAGRQA